MEKTRLSDEQVKVIAGGTTAEEIIEASRAWLPDRIVQCKSCRSTFNAKDNAYGFIDRYDFNTGVISSVAVAKCPDCGMMWSQS